LVLVYTSELQMLGVCGRAVFNEEEYHSHSHPWQAYHLSIDVCGRAIFDKEECDRHP